MTTSNLVLRATGSSISFYLTPSKKYSPHIDEAQKFNSIDDAKEFIKGDNDTYSVVTLDSKFVTWVNY